MDRKIHIHFFPRDSSRVRVISFSRAIGLAVMFTAVPLCLLGFWLVASRVLHESPIRKVERTRLEHENHALREKTGMLQRDASGLENNLDSLESTRIRALMATGLQSQETPQSETHSNPFNLFHFGERQSVTTQKLSDDLKKTREASLFFDSSLFVLSRQRDLASRIPTSYPIGAGALIIRPFGASPDPFTGKKSFHGGVDFSLQPGAPIYAAGSGTVTEAGLDPIWGNFVRVRHTNRLETFYAHLQQTRVHNGQEISRGQVIGWLGQSGAATGPHLHFEVLFKGERVDPLRYLLPPETPVNQQMSDARP